MIYPAAIYRDREKLSVRASVGKIDTNRYQMEKHASFLSQKHEEFSAL